MQTIVVLDPQTQFDHVVLITAWPLTPEEYARRREDLDVAFEEWVEEQPFEVDDIDDEDIQPLWLG